MKYGKTILIAILVLMSVLPGTAYAQNADTTYKIGDLILVGEEGFIAKMTELGYMEGENVTYLYLSSFEDVPMEEWEAEYKKQIQAMVDARVDVFVTNTDTDAAYIRALAGDIPIVFARSDDPVATGAVADLINPGGYSTGIITNKPHERRLQILTEILPTTKKVYYLYSPYTLEAEVVLQQVQDLADKLGVEIVAAQITMDPGSGPEAIKNIPEDADWVFLTPFVFFDPQGTEELLATTISRQAGICGVTDLPIQGYLMGYGPNLDATGRQAAQIVDRILRGASPGDLPVQTAENYLTVNLEAAEAIHLEIPEVILRQADLIIRPGYFESLATATPGS
jgi:putative ABC transport system substrate-binding protein